MIDISKYKSCDDNVILDRIEYLKHIICFEQSDYSYYKTKLEIYELHDLLKRKELNKIHDMLVDLQCNLQNTMSFNITKPTQTTKEIAVYKQVQDILNYVSELI